MLMFFQKREKKKREEKAFTLVEILVSLTLFSIVLVASFGALMAVISANNKAKTIKLVVNNLSMALENMSRELRVGYGYTCNSTEPDGTPDTPGGQDCSGGDSVAFWTKDGAAGFYRYDLGSKKISRKINGKDTSVVSIIGDEVDIEDLDFYVTGTASGDNIQPRIFLKLKGVVSQLNVQTEFNIQTTISQRKIAP